MRLKNLAWAFLFLPNIAGSPPRVPRPLAPAAIPAPVCIGEAHNQPEHTRIERETILALRRRGYTTVDFELPRDLQKPLETYLRSKRGPEDVETFFTPLVDLTTASMHLFVPPFLRERIIKDTEHDPDLRRALDLTATSYDAGFAVHLIDVPTDSPSSQAHNNEELFANMPPRNEAMAEMLAKDAARGGTIALNGDLHESTTMVSNSLPEALLKNSGIPCQVFELAIDGQRPEIALGVPPRELEPAGRLVSSSQEILAALDADSGLRRIPRTLPEALPVSPIRDTMAAR